MCNSFSLCFEPTDLSKGIDSTFFPHPLLFISVVRHSIMRSSLVVFGRDHWVQFHGGMKATRGNGGGKKIWVGQNQLQKCLHAYSKLPTVHINQDLYRHSLFPSHCLLTSRKLKFPSVSCREVSEQDDYLKEELKQQEAWAGAWFWGMRQVFCVSVKVCSCMQGWTLCQLFVWAINEVVVVPLWSRPAWTRSPSSWPFVAVQMV